MTELEHLKYPIGKFKALSPVDQSTLNQAIEDISSLPEKFSAAVTFMTNDQLDTPYRPGGWTVRQLAHHVADSHMNAYVRMKIALTEKDPTIRPYEEGQWAELKDSANTRVQISLDMLKLLHQRWSVLIKSLDDLQLKRKYYHPGDQEWVNLRTMICMYAWHGNHHLAHVTRLIERQGW
ncbi:MAG: putative metal-dependent hydrolase [Cyclobacteriaceae bacterium]